MNASSPPVRLLLVEDHEMVLEAMQAALASHTNIEVVAVAGSVHDATEALKSVDVDMVVTDLRLGDGAGTDLVEVAQSLKASPPVLLITGTDDQRGINDALDAGCAGFVSKSEGFDRLVDAIRAISTGGVFFPAVLLAERLRPGTTRPGATLTARELQVLQLLAQAMSVTDIAGELVLSVHTVRNHIKQVLAKLHARSQLEAVVIGARNGLVEIT